MQATMSRPQLAAAIGKIQGAVAKRPSIPILGNFLLEANQNRITISATDLKMGIQAEIEAHISAPGAMTLPAHRFSQLVRELAAPDIHIETEQDDVALIRATSAHFRLRGMDKSGFPALPLLSRTHMFTLPTATYKTLLTHSSFASARDDSRQVLNGILMRVKNSQLTCVGTDGKRLAQTKAPIEMADDYHNDYLIPLRSIEEMVKLLTDEEEVTIILTPDKIGMEIGSTSLITQLLAGEFPDIERIIPNEIKTKIALHREELMMLLRQIALFTPDRGHSVLFTFDIGELKISAANQTIGDAQVSMPVDYQGKRLEIAFNPLFFHDILRHCTDEIISLSLNGPYDPGLITDESGFTFVLMPMRLQPT